MPVFFRKRVGWSLQTSERLRVMRPVPCWLPQCNFNKRKASGTGADSQPMCGNDTQRGTTGCWRRPAQAWAELGENSFLGRNALFPMIVFAFKYAKVFAVFTASRLGLPFISSAVGFSTSLLGFCLSFQFLSSGRLHLWFEMAWRNFPPQQREVFIEGCRPSTSAFTPLVSFKANVHSTACWDPCFVCGCLLLNYAWMKSSGKGKIFPSDEWAEWSHMTDILECSWNPVFRHLGLQQKSIYMQWWCKPCIHTRGMGACTDVCVPSVRKSMESKALCKTSHTNLVLAKASLNFEIYLSPTIQVLPAFPFCTPTLPFLGVGF